MPVSSTGSPKSCQSALDPHPAAGQQRGTRAVVALRQNSAMLRLAQPGASVRRLSQDRTQSRFGHDAKDQRVDLQECRKILKTNKYLRLGPADYKLGLTSWQSGVNCRNSLYRSQNSMASAFAT